MRRGQSTLKRSALFVCVARCGGLRARSAGKTSDTARRFCLVQFVGFARHPKEVAGVGVGAGDTGRGTCAGEGPDGVRLAIAEDELFSADQGVVATVDCRRPAHRKENPVSFAQPAERIALDSRP